MYSTSQCNLFIIRECSVCELNWFVAIIVFLALIAALLELCRQFKTHILFYWCQNVLNSFLKKCSRTNFFNRESLIFMLQPWRSWNHFKNDITLNIFLALCRWLQFFYLCKINLMDQQIREIFTNSFTGLYLWKELNLS